MDFSYENRHSCFVIDKSVKPFSKAPPPASVIPWSIMSAASSGGVLSRVTFIASTICDKGSESASMNFVEVTVMFSGRPVRFLPYPLMSHLHLGRQSDCNFNIFSSFTNKEIIFFLYNL